MGRTERNGLQIDHQLVDFLETDALPGTGLDAGAFWAAFSDLIHEFGPRNRALVARRKELQGKIDGWHQANVGRHDQKAYRAFLEGDRVSGARRRRFRGYYAECRP